MNCSVFSVRKFDYFNTHYATPHKHNLYEINCYASGKGYTIIDNKRYEFQDSCFAFIPPNVQHDEKFLSSGQVICILFEASEIPFVCPEPLIVCKGDEPIIPYAKAMFKETTEQKNFYNYIINHLLKILLTEIHRMLFNTVDESCKSIAEIKNYINENFYKKISLTELAPLSGYSYDYFRHYFKKQYGISPQNYLIKVRLENAYSMLSSTPDMRITDVAADCGFSDSSQFSTMFTNHFGITPKKFQKMQKAKQTE